MQNDLEVRNASYANAEGTAINVELNHPRLGWIPFTASENDVEEHGRVIFADIKSGNKGPIAAYVPPPTPPEPTSSTEGGTIAPSDDTL